MNIDLGHVWQKSLSDSVESNIHLENLGGKSYPVEPVVHCALYYGLLNGRYDGYGTNCADGRNDTMLYLLNKLADAGRKIILINNQSNPIYENRLEDGHHALRRCISYCDWPLVNVKDLEEDFLARAEGKKPKAELYICDDNDITGANQNGALRDLKRYAYNAHLTRIFPDLSFRRKQTTTNYDSWAALQEYLEPTTPTLF